MGYHNDQLEGRTQLTDEHIALLREAERRPQLQHDIGETLLTHLDQPTEPVRQYVPKTQYFPSREMD